jgi:hypothetical protein
MLSAAPSFAADFNLDVPSVGTLHVAAGKRVTTHTAPFLGLPAATADVTSTGTIHLSTEANRWAPRMATVIHRPFEYFSTVGSATWRVTPFRWPQRVR